MRNFSSSVEKYFTSEGSERMKYFSAQEEKFHIFKRPCNVLFIISTPMKYQTISIFASKDVIYVTTATVVFPCKITLLYHVFARKLFI